MIKTILLTITLTFLTVPALAQDQNIDNVGSATVAADSNATGAGDVELKTKGLTGFRLLNDGNVSITNRIGINTTSPLSQLHFKVPYAAGSTQTTEIARIESPTEGHLPFKVKYRSTYFGGGNNTDSFSMGWGHDDDPWAFNILMEDEFGQLPDPVNAELHIQIYSSERGTSRPLFSTFNRHTDEASFTWNGSSAFRTANSNDPSPANTFIFGKNEFLAILVQGGWRFQADSVKFETRSNGGAPAKQIRFIPSPLDAAQTMISFGGNALLGNVGPAVAALNPDGTLGRFTASRFATESIGFDDTYGLRIASGTALRFSSTNSPFGTSDVQMVRTGTRAAKLYDPSQNTPTLLNASFDVSTANGGKYHANGVSGVTMSGSKCVIKEITAGIITKAVCTP